MLKTFPFRSSDFKAHISPRRRPSTPRRKGTSYSVPETASRILLISSVVGSYSARGSSVLNEYEKEKNENIELENEVTELKSRYLEMKKNEMSTNSRGRESDRLNNSTIRTISVGKYGPLSRYQNDLNYFKDLIVKMNDEIKNT